MDELLDEVDEHPEPIQIPQAAKMLRVKDEA
jgi:hypothetical protein